MPAGTAYRKRFRIWELGYFSLVAGTCLGAWALSESVPLVSVMTLAVLCVIAILRSWKFIEVRVLGVSITLKR